MFSTILNICSMLTAKQVYFVVWHVFVMLICEGCTCCVSGVLLSVIVM